MKPRLYYKALVRVTNPVLIPLLRSPFGGPLRKQFMVLRFTGTTVPVCYLPASFLGSG